MAEWLKGAGMKRVIRKRRFYIPGVLVLTFLLIFVWMGSIAGQSSRGAITHDKTNFPLIGKHRTIPCSLCHLNNIRRGTPRDCEACHWYRKQDDRYKLQLGLHCEDCHTPYSWKKVKPNSWDHEQEVGFRLEGVHKTLDCDECHTSGTFAAEVGDCIICHRKEYESVTDPNHMLGQFPSDCSTCHTMLHWEGTKDFHFSFALYGLHKTADCVDCHKNNLYKGTPSECAACHLEQYQGAVNPNHTQAGYPTDCEICHGTGAVDWYGADVNHDRFWTLKGAHRGLDCITCHSSGYNITNDCINCHLDDYNNTRDPNHQVVGFHTDCEECHLDEARTWSLVVYDHNFPIFSGQHQSATCLDCHRNSNFYEFSCIDCHEHNKNDMDLKHQNIGGYVYNSQACYSCHPRGSK